MHFHDVVLLAATLCVTEAIILRKDIACRISQHLYQIVELHCSTDDIRKYAGIIRSPWRLLSVIPFSVTINSITSWAAVNVKIIAPGLFCRGGDKRIEVNQMWIGSKNPIKKLRRKSNGKRFKSPSGVCWRLNRFSIYRISCWRWGWCGRCQDKLKMIFYKMEEGHHFKRKKGQEQFNEMGIKIQVFFQEILRDQFFGVLLIKILYNRSQN